MADYLGIPGVPLDEGERNGEPGGRMRVLVGCHTDAYHWRFPTAQHRMAAENSQIDARTQQLPNGVHLYRIREALSHGHATVMIGSGFSRNAVGGHQLPLWRDLMDGLLADLYPAEKDCAKAAQRFGGISGSLRLAQEYEAVLGRARLDRRLEQLLPDQGKTEPGDLHKRLMALPWADVFTTNYDTLLERTLEQDSRQLKPKIQRRYQIVKSSADLPFSRSNSAPRIVKLHGTLGASLPLVVTEEDYRCYPRDYAPFVNMVQQSMLENVFCLLGFSGDDPNFIQWSGWTRDRLGPHSPPIYLITIEPVSEGQRLILEERKIFPIPIATLASQSGNTHGAFRALLDFWHGQPLPRPALWGDGYSQPSGVDKAEALLKWTQAARDVRLAYPGWLVAPHTNRIRVSQHSHVHHLPWRYRKHAEDLSLAQRLSFLFERNWILELLLCPLSRNDSQDYEAALKLVPDFLTSPQEDDAGETSIADAREQWEGLVVALLRHCRETADWERFRCWQSKLLAQAGSDSEALRWMRYEETLFLLESMQYQEAMEALQAWPSLSETADPYWLIRRGALMGELGHGEEGQHWARMGLARIRAAIQANGERTSLVSREHWAEMLFRVASSAQDLQRPPSTRRRRATRELLPDALRPEAATAPEPSSDFDEVEEISRQASAEEHSDHPLHQIDRLRQDFVPLATALKQVVFDFDAPGVAGRHDRSSISSRALEAATAFVRMVEVASYVPRFAELGLAAPTLDHAFLVLAARSPIVSAIRVLLRANSASNDALESLTRENVARLPQELAIKLFATTLGVLDSVADSMHFSPAQARRLAFAIELSSRLASRVEEDRVIDLLDRFQRYHSHAGVHQDYSLHRPLSNLLRRALRALRPHSLSTMAPTLLALKPPTLESIRMSHWPRVARWLPADLPLDASRKEWEALAQNLLNDAARARAHFDGAAGNDEPMAFHLERLHWLCEHDLLDPQQQQKFGDLAWSLVPPNDPPESLPGFYLGALLKWPVPTHMDAAKEFKSWMIAQPLRDLVEHSEHEGVRQRGITDRDEILLYNLLLTRHHKGNFAWTKTELLAVCENLRAWWVREGSALSERLDSYPREVEKSVLVRRLRMLGHVMQRLICPALGREDAIAASLPDWLAQLWEAGQRHDAPVQAYQFAALSWWPEQAPVVMRMTVSQLATSDATFQSGLAAAGHWLISEKRTSTASLQFTSLLVNTLMLRAEGRLAAVLDCVREVLELGALEHFRECRELLFSALCDLFEALATSDDDTGFLDLESRPELRLRALRTLRVVVNIFSDLKDVRWQRCIEIAASDPFAEVRHCICE